MDILLIIMCIFFGYGAFDYFSKKEKHGCWLLSALALFVVVIFMSSDDFFDILMVLILVFGIIGIIGFLMYLFRN